MSTGLLTTKQAAERMGMKRRAFEIRRTHCRYFPAAVKVDRYWGAMYRAEDIDAYADLRPYQPRKAPGRRLPSVGLNPGPLADLNRLVRGSAAGHWWGG